MASNNVLKSRIIAIIWSVSLVLCVTYSLFKGIWPMWPAISLHLMAATVLLSISNKVPMEAEELYFPIHAAIVWPLMGLAYVLFEVSSYFEEMYPDNKVVVSTSQAAQDVGFLLDKLIFSKLVMLPSKGIAQVLHFMFLKSNTRRIA